MTIDYIENSFYPWQITGAWDSKLTAVEFYKISEWMRREMGKRAIATIEESPTTPYYMMYRFAFISHDDAVLTVIKYS